MNPWTDISKEQLESLRPTTADDFQKLYMQHPSISERGSGRTIKQLCRLRGRALFIVYDEREKMHVEHHVLRELRPMHEGAPVPVIMTVHQFSERQIFAGRPWDDFDVDHDVWPRLSDGPYHRETRFRDVMHQFLKWTKIEDASLFKGSPPI